MEYSETVCVALKENLDIYLKQKDFPLYPEKTFDSAINIIIMDLLVWLSLHLNPTQNISAYVIFSKIQNNPKSYLVQMITFIFQIP